MSWRSTKTYEHSEGISACFRQWRASHSHCRFLHGYALSFKLTFAAFELDERGWVMDFGGLKEIKAWLKDTFDHKTVVAADDPELDSFRALDDAGMIQLVILDDGVGCERFARHVYDYVTQWLAENNPRVRVVEVECREHGGNSAAWSDL